MSNLDLVGKYRNWVFTWNDEETYGLPNAEELKVFLEKECEIFVFQLEKGEIGQRKHWQGCFRTKIRVRKSTLIHKFEMYFLNQDIAFLTLNRMCGTWEESFTYCTKAETRIGDGFITCDSLSQYEGKDISFLTKEDNLFPWQQNLLYILLAEDKSHFKTPDDRTIYWISDSKGNSGKSKLVKWLCFNFNGCIKVPFGSATQIRSACIAAGKKQCYIVDIPKTLGEDDSLNAVISAIEDLKNGHVVTGIYGKYESMMFDPPHVVCFSNSRCPTHLMSSDRWKTKAIDPVDKTWIPGEWLCD